jgi:hypothetical protein
MAVVRMCRLRGSKLVTVAHLGGQRHATVPACDGLYTVGPHFAHPVTPPRVGQGQVVAALAADHLGVSAHGSRNTLRAGAIRSVGLIQREPGKRCGQRRQGHSIVGCAAAIGAPHQLRRQHTSEVTHAGGDGLLNRVVGVQVAGHGFAQCSGQ